MAYLGDIALGQTLDFNFTTRQISGAPSTLSSSPVLSAYVSNSTTELTAGITLSVDFDTRTGLNHVRIVATSGNGYATASDYSVVITTGTVNSVSVVGEVVGDFSIENRQSNVKFWNGTAVATPATAGIPDVNVKNYNNGAVATAATGIPKVDIDTIKTNGVVNGGTITFPTTATLASTTNITAGTITTVTTTTTATNLTNLPSIPANWITATGITAAALNGKGDWLLASSAPTNFSALAITAGGAVTAGTVSDKTGYSLSGTQTFNNTGTWTGSITGSVGSVTGAVGSVTGSVGSVVGLTASNLDTTVSSRMATFSLPTNFSALSITAGGLTATIDWTTQMTESYRANGAAPTPAQAVCEILAHLGEASIVSTTKTINKFDHATAAETFTLDSATTPAAITRAT